MFIDSEYRPKIKGSRNANCQFGCWIPVETDATNSLRYSELLKI